MLRSGQFDNLQWDKLAEAHRANWRLLQTRYNLPPQQIEPTASLSDLAVQSVQACRKYLFTDGECEKGWQRGESSAILPMEDLEDCLAPALYDHLIVTFAHRFFCDNLTPKTLPECLDAIYNCLNESKRIAYKDDKKLKEDKDGTRTLKSNFTRPKKRSCEAYDEKINTVFSFYEQQLQPLCRSVSETQIEELKRRKWLVTNRRQMMVSHKRRKTSNRKQRRFAKRRIRLNDHAFLIVPQRVDFSPKVRSDLALIQKERLARAAEQYAAPNWLYTVAMACNWTNNPLAVKNDDLVFERDYRDRTNLLQCLTKFLGNSKWGPMLFGVATAESKRIAHPSFVPVVQTEEMVEKLKQWQQQASSFMELRLDSSNHFFAGVPYVNDQTYRYALPPQSYTVIGTLTTYKIPSEVQQVLNSYLVERTFHGYAIIVAIEYIKARQSFGLSELHHYQYQQLTTVVRLRAPLVHSAWIELTGYVVETTTLKKRLTAIPWIEDRIDYWNRLALPVLEEYFIRSVWLRYRKINY